MEEGQTVEIQETREPLREQGSIRALLELLEQQGMEPVSYTHLDVYKRQPYDYAKAPLSHEDVTIDTRRLDDYELLSAEEILGGEQSF